MDLARKFSREDLLRAFDVLTRVEADIRAAAQPRYHFEMALLRWIYLRKLVPIEDLIAGAATGGSSRAVAPTPAAARLATAQVAPALRTMPTSSSVKTTSTVLPPNVGRPATKAEPQTGSIKNALLAEIRKSKVVFFNTVVAQAQTIEVGPDRVTFTFSPAQRTLREMLEQNRPWLETLARQFGGPAMAVVSTQIEAAPAQANGMEPAEPDRKSLLREQALADASVQALLDVFPADIRDVEEI